MPDDSLKVCLGMPGYGRMTAAAAVGLFCASTGTVEIGGETKTLDIDRIYNSSSLLAQNFNALWAWPLNLMHEGTRVDYFAMQHDDVEPQKNWLDVAIEELERCDLDILGVVVPIKDPNGLTSLALDRDDGDAWRPQCRLTMTEVYRLPETFTSEDVGYRLLLNTGLWVCRFNPEWASQVQFSINDRISFDPNRTPAYVAEVEPEDWYFSRQCHRLGLRIGATRKIIINHAGEQRFSNCAPWGQLAFDSEYTTESVVPEPRVLAIA